ncbi:MAG: DNA translocase FtsK [Clostridia bacterium]
MNKKKSTSKKKTTKKTKNDSLHTPLWRHITAICSLFFAVFLLIALFFDVTGIFGRFLSSCFKGLLGGCAYTIPLLLIYFTIWMLTGKGKSGNKKDFNIKLISGIVFVISASILLELLSGDSLAPADKITDLIVRLWNNGNSEVLSGGLIGGLLFVPFFKIFDNVGTGIIVGLICFVSFMLLSGLTFISIIHFFSPKKIKTMAETVSTKIHGNAEDYNNIIKEKTAKKKKPSSIDIPVDDMLNPNSVPNTSDIMAALTLDEAEEPPFEPIKTKGKADNSIAHEIISSYKAATDSNYIFPPVSLLKHDTKIAPQDISNELKNNSIRLIDTLKSFGVDARVVNVSRGPSVTRYELAPGPGVKISKISNLADDIALNLAAVGVRIEAPIPGKSAVGIEIPNKNVSLVPIREMIISKEFGEAKSSLTCSLGRDITGSIITVDLGKMPHLLIAGSTGSGKSVCINSLIISLLYKSSPEDVKMLMIDPKVVELSVYNDIPHLLIPVVTDPKKAAGALNWAVVEMLNRYKSFAEQNVRDIAGFNDIARITEELVVLPKIVMIIDELADLMMVAPTEVEDAICRLAQMGRAAGMHLVIATQRPSVDVLTGTIKANVPSRIAFSVSDAINSRIILDMSGAEKLLGKGDMLYNPVGISKPIRVQGCFVTDKEVESVTKFISDNEKAVYNEMIISHIENQAINSKGKGAAKEENNGDTDVMLPNAIEVILDAGLCSVSLLQRKLKLGYARAARIVDEMEELGYVGPYEGSKPRQLIITRSKYQEMLMNKQD